MLCCLRPGHCGKPEQRRMRSCLLEHCVLLWRGTLLQWREKTWEQLCPSVVVVKRAPERGMETVGRRQKQGCWVQAAYTQIFIANRWTSCSSLACTQDVPLVRFNTLLYCDMSLCLHGVVLDGMLVAEGGGQCCSLDGAFPWLRAAWGASDFQTWSISSFPILFPLYAVTHPFSWEGEISCSLP